MPLLGPDGNTPVAEPAAPAITQVVTAFLVFQLPNGAWELTPDINAPLVPARPPTTHDILGAVANLQADVHAQRSASLTVGTLQHGAAQAQQRVLSPEEQAALRASMGRR